MFLYLVVPSEAFNIALDLPALGIIASWGHDRDLPDPAVSVVETRNPAPIPSSPKTPLMDEFLEKDAKDAKQ